MRRVLLVAFCLAFSACGSCDKATPSEAAVVRPAEPPVIAPEGMLAELVLTTPNTTWSRLQKGIGGTVGILPFTFGGLLATLAGFDPNLGQEIDGAAPAFAVFVGDPADPSFAIAVKLVDARHARLAFVDADDARFSTKAGEGGIVELVPKGIPPPVVVGLANGGYLVVARSSEDLKALGPYAYRTLPTRRTPSAALAVEVPHAALAGKLRERVARQWASFKDDKSAQDDQLRKQHGGRAPDFGDPQAILGAVDRFVQKKLSLLADLQRIAVEVEVGDGDVHAAAKLVPEKDGPFSAAIRQMHVGDASPLLGVDADAPFALLLRDDAAERLSDAASLHGAIASTLGKRLPEAEGSKLKGALEEWARGRGDWMSVAVSTQPSLGLVVRAPVQNAEASARAVRTALELLKAPAFKEPLEAHVKMTDVTFTNVELAGFGKAQVATIVREEPRPALAKEADGGAPGAKKRRISVAWGVANDQIRMALAEDAPSLLVATPTKTMQELPFAKTALGRMNGAAVVAILHPGKTERRGSPLAGSPATPTGGASPLAGAPATRGGGEPFALAWGRQNDDGFVRVSATHSALRDLLRKQLGF